MKRAVESGEVTISAIRHKKARAKSEPSLTAAVMAELAADTNYLDQSSEAGGWSASYVQSQNALIHQSDHETNMASASLDLCKYSSDSNNVDESFEAKDDNRSIPKVSFSKTAELKLEQIKKMHQEKLRGEHPETYFGGDVNIETMMESERNVDIVQITSRPSGPDFWEVDRRGEEHTSSSGSHAREYSNTSWSSGRGSLASDNHLHDGTTIQVIKRLMITFLNCRNNVEHPMCVLTFTCCYTMSKCMNRITGIFSQGKCISVKPVITVTGLDGTCLVTHFMKSIFHVIL